MDRAVLERMIEEGCSLEEMGRRVQRDPSTVSYWLSKHGLEAVNRERHRARGGISEDVLRAHVELGHTISEIALAVDRSKATVRHWLRRYGLRTRNGTGRRARAEVRQALAEGQRRATMVCAHHGSTEFVWEGGGTFRCARCRAAAVVRRRRRVKAILVAEAGGRCLLCGWDHSPEALHFHHLDPAQKAFALSRHGVTRSLERARAEAAKCVLLCANCHACVEAGTARLP